MENILNLTPIQSILVVVLNAWIFVIFPIIVIRKLNYLTNLVEAQFEPDTQPPDHSSEE